MTEIKQRWSLPYKPTPNQVQIPLAVALELSAEPVDGHTLSVAFETTKGQRGVGDGKPSGIQDSHGSGPPYPGPDTAVG